MKINRTLALVILAGVIVTAATFIALAIYVSSTISAVSTAANASVQGQLNLSISLGQANFFTYYYGTKIVPYVRLNYSEKNATNANLFVGVYSSNPVQRIYLINVTDYCYQCLNEHALLENFTRYALSYGFIRNSTSFAYLNINQLKYMPPRSIVILPSGLLPIVMLPDSPIKGNFSILSLLARGDTVIYVGDDFSRSVGLLGAAIFSNYTNSTRILDDAGLGTFPSLYTPVNNTLGLHFDSPTFNFSGGESSAYGPLTYKYAGTGTLVAFSNTPANSWNDTSQMASDIAKAILSHFWDLELASGYNNIAFASGSQEGTLGALGYATRIENTKGTGQVLNNSYALAIMTLYNKRYFLAKDMVFRIRFNPNGTLSMPSIIGVGERIPIGINISTARNREIISHLQFTNINMSSIRNVSLSFFNVSPQISYTQKTVVVAFPQGYYITLLKDYNGSLYGGAIFRMAPLLINPILLDFSNQSFSFRVASNGQNVNNVGYSVDINGTYRENGTISDGIISYQLPKGAIIPSGNVTFDIGILGTVYRYKEPYSNTPIRIPPFYIELAFVIALIVILNIISKAPERDEYYVDVQDFRETKKTSIKVDRSEVLGVFDKVNYAYHWRYMPLTLDEIRNGINANLKYNDTPLSITTQNTVFVLNKIIAKGEVAETDGYFAPVSWIKNSKHDIEYLTVFRRLRDYCIKNAVLFTELDSVDFSDMVLTKNNVQNYVIIYSEGATPKDIRVTDSRRIVLAFLDEDRKADFMQELYSSYGPETENLKMAIDYGYVTAVDTEHLESVIF